jgi:hypothetical protein
VIVDAVTSARFQKRSLEILVLALLEPVDGLAPPTPPSPLSGNGNNIDEYHDLAQQFTPQPGGWMISILPLRLFSRFLPQPWTLHPRVPTTTRQDINPPPIGDPNRFSASYGLLSPSPSAPLSLQPDRRRL